MLEEIGKLWVPWSLPSGEVWMGDKWGERCFTNSGGSCWKVSLPCLLSCKLLLSVCQALALKGDLCELVRPWLDLAVVAPLCQEASPLSTDFSLTFTVLSGEPSDLIGLPESYLVLCLSALFSAVSLFLKFVQEGHLEELSLSRLELLLVPELLAFCPSFPNPAACPCKLILWLASLWAPFGDGLTKKEGGAVPLLDGCGVPGPRATPRRDDLCRFGWTCS